MQKQLYHHGILGQRWGVRRFQNSDGTLTSAGKNRYNETPHQERQRHKREQKRYNAIADKAKSSEQRYRTEYDDSDEGKSKRIASQEAYRQFDKALKQYESRPHDPSKDHYDKDGYLRLHGYPEDKEEKWINSLLDYNRSSSTYVAKKMLNEFGKYDFAVFVSEGRVEMGKDYAKKFIYDRTYRTGFEK